MPISMGADLASRAAADDALLFLGIPEVSRRPNHTGTERQDKCVKETITREKVRTDCGDFEH